MKDLAPSNRINNLIIPIIVGLFFGFLGYYILTENYSGKALLTIAIIFGLIFIWVYIAFRTYNFHYDSEYLILKNSKTLIKVHFNKIDKVKLTLADLKYWV